MPPCPSGITNIVHVSALGADADSDSDYARTKAEGEEAFRDYAPETVILRPSIIFGPEDQFFNRFAGLAKISPVLPLVGPDTRFQPVYVDDVAAAAVAAIETGATGVFELGGPGVYTFRALMQAMLKEIRRRRILAPLPFFVAGAMAWTLDLIGSITSIIGVGNTQLTQDQVKLLRNDNVADGPGLEALGVNPTALEAVIGEYLYAYRPYGQYDAITESAARLKS